MRSRPEGFDETELTAVLAEKWGFDAVTVDYHPEGFGSYHWIVTDHAGARRFVTVDDLDAKTWLGSTRAAVFGGLQRAFDTAFALRHRAQLAFVLAPLPSHTRATVIRINDRYAVTLFPIATGRSVGFGQRPTPADLWMINGITDAEIAQYEESASRRVDPRAMDLYRLRWDLADTAEYLRVLRAPHDHTADTEHAAEMLDHYVQVERRWAAFLR